MIFRPLRGLCGPPGPHDTGILRRKTRAFDKREENSLREFSPARSVPETPPPLAPVACTGIHLTLIPKPARPLVGNAGPRGEARQVSPSSSVAAFARLLCHKPNPHRPADIVALHPSNGAHGRGWRRVRVSQLYFSRFRASKKARGVAPRAFCLLRFNRCRSGARCW